MIYISISQDFTRTPGARFKSKGKYSGEQFREEILEPKFLEAKNTNQKLHIDLDGGYGYAQSFLEEAFGGLARLYDAISVEDAIGHIKSDDEPGLVRDVMKYIRNATQKEAVS